MDSNINIVESEINETEFKKFRTAMRGQEQTAESKVYYFSSQTTKRREKSEAEKHLNR